MLSLSDLRDNEVRMVQEVEALHSDKEHMQQRVILLEAELQNREKSWVRQVLLTV